MNRGLSYALCGAQRTATTVIEHLATQSDILLPVEDIVYGADYSNLGPVMSQISTAITAADGYREQTVSYFTNLKYSLQSNAFKMGFIVTNPVVNDFVYTNASVPIGIVLNLQNSTMTTAAAEATAIMSNLSNSELTLDYLVEYNAVFGDLVSSTIVKNQDKFQLIQKWLREGSLGMFILLFIPVLAIFLAVCVYAPASHSSTFTDPRVRPYSSFGSALTWFATFGYAFVTMAIAAAAFALSYEISGSCLVGRDIGSEVANFTHLFNQNFTQASTDNWAALVQAIVSDDSEVDNLVVGTDPATALTFRDSLMGIITNVEEFVALEVTKPSLPYNLTLMANAFEAQGGIMVPSSSFFSLGYGTIFQVSWTAYNVSRNENSTLNMTENEFSALFNLSYATAASCSNVSFDIDGEGYSIFNSTARSIDSAFGDFWPAGVIPGLNYTLGKMIEYEVISNSTTCEGLLELNSTEAIAALSAGSVGPFAYQISFIVNLMNMDGFLCQYMDLVDSQISEGSQTLLFVNETCNFTTFTQTLETKVPLSLQYLQNNFDAAVENIDLTYWEAYNTTLNDADVPTMIYSSLDSELIPVSAGGNWNVFLSAGCQTAVPGYLMLSVTLFMFGICSLFAVIAQFIVWRRIVDNFSLWADIRRAAGNVPQV